MPPLPSRRIRDTTGLVGLTGAFSPLLCGILSVLTTCSVTPHCRYPYSSATRCYSCGSCRTSLQPISLQPQQPHSPHWLLREPSTSTKNPGIVSKISCSISNAISKGGGGLGKELFLKNPSGRTSPGSLTLVPRGTQTIHFHLDILSHTRNKEQTISSLSSFIKVFDLLRYCYSYLSI